jgi:hypothetical protein
LLLMALLTQSRKLLMQLLPQLKSLDIPAFAAYQIKSHRKVAFFTSHDPS